MIKTLEYRGKMIQTTIYGNFWYFSIDGDQCLESFKNENQAVEVAKQLIDGDSKDATI